MSETVEYRIRPVTRFIVTSYRGTENVGTSRQHGEFDNAETAYAVGYALARADHERLGYPLGDERIRYPEQIHLGVPADSDPRADVAPSGRLA